MAITITIHAYFNLEATTTKIFSIFTQVKAI